MNIKAINDMIEDDIKESVLKQALEYMRKDKDFFMKIAQIIKEDCPFQDECWEEMQQNYEPITNEGYI